jgi:hypothetical protein
MHDFGRDPADYCSNDQVDDDVHFSLQFECSNSTG